MEVIVSGHQVDTSEALRGRVEERMQAIADKYFSRAMSSQVTFGRGPHDNGFRCSIVSHVINGVVLKSTGDGGEANLAFDQAAEKIEKQLRRYTRRLKSHHGGEPTAQALAEQSKGYDAGYRILDGGADEEEPADNPLVIAETSVDIPETTPADAVMMLDLRHTNALMFKNRGSGAFNMVYRRDDGTIGWVEPRV
ncbi:MAG: Ribosome hibernation promoting factor Hpf [uncultured Sphingomonadaceae bacterium]|uniref:Ribosome hibernation promoting factor n=1 Tax=uncultured Sphingomonadaceae bacterium TaxID=169976 RepID=A0A6J4SZ31_9SPHN|nr:MAG: Ribosome hibernation promoting factor Hpf [uncultured Sphingomonadaceae bacterium]